MTSIKKAPRREGRLVFGSVNEDAAIEAAVLPGQGRLLVIASGGDVAMRLAAGGAEVTAVDSNPVQIDYVRERLRGAPARLGKIERMQQLSRYGLTLAGLRSGELIRFCAMDDPAEQLRVWRERFDTRRLRAILAVLASRTSTRAAGSEAYSSRAPMRFDVLLRTRFERGITHHPNRHNPFVRRLLLGDFDDPIPPFDPRRVKLVCADVAAHLEEVPAGTYDGISLSNVLDAAGPVYTARLKAAVRHATTPGAVVVSRSFAESDNPDETQWASRDRSMLWGSLKVEQPGAR
jgi:S-adenosylmethionine:diacylglycerol 3-amino-3-carboxypropyl transferase